MGDLGVIWRGGVWCWCLSLVESWDRPPFFSSSSWCKGTVVWWRNECHVCFLWPAAGVREYAVCSVTSKVAIKNATEYGTRFLIQHHTLCGCSQFVFESQKYLQMSEINLSDNIFSLCNHSLHMFLLALREPLVMIQNAATPDALLCCRESLTIFSSWLCAHTVGAPPCVTTITYRAHDLINT